MLSPRPLWVKPKTAPRAGALPLAGAYRFSFFQYNRLSITSLLKIF
jgi:hypothetical protein